MVSVKNIQKNVRMVYEWPQIRYPCQNIKILLNMTTGYWISPRKNVPKKLSCRCQFLSFPITDDKSTILLIVYMSVVQSYKSERYWNGKKEASLKIRYKKIAFQLSTVFFMYQKLFCKWNVLIKKLELGKLHFIFKPTRLSGAVVFKMTDWEHFFKERPEFQIKIMVKLWSFVNSRLQER